MRAHVGRPQARRELIAGHQRQADVDERHLRAHSSAIASAVGDQLDVLHLLAGVPFMPGADLSGAASAISSRTRPGAVRSTRL
jgi:hypothetical protein